MSRKPPPQLPEGRMLRCPTKGCPNWLYAYVTTSGKLIAACPACKFSHWAPSPPEGEPAKEQG